MDTFYKKCLLVLSILLCSMCALEAWKGYKKAELISKITGRAVTPLEASFITIMVMDEK